ncbi:MAG: L,D-transpeptidase family protein [Nitrospirae bacterium]|nr:L,D-transpeptidase family protein [Nitrospirota bacterium]
MIYRGIFKTVFLLFCLVIIYGCNTAPVPPEVKETEKQENDLWRAGAEIYLPEQYKAYRTALRLGKDHLIEVNQKFILFRRYKNVQQEFRGLLSKGSDLFENLEDLKQAKSAANASQIAFLQSKIEALKNVTSLMNEGRLSRRQLVMAELLLNEVKLMNERGRYLDAEKKLKIIPVYTESAREAISPILDRYSDKAQIAKWRTWVNEAIETSKERGIYSIFVSKIDKKLILYKNGSPYKTYSIGLGKNGFHDKLYAGDLATPEGKYQVIKKQFRSRYYKALLINYPNEEDRRQFHTAKRNGLVPASAGIGGLIEIHGGGKESTTYGCISMENNQIDELFKIVDIGTPVTIVGAIEYVNTISSAIKDL